MIRRPTSGRLTINQEVDQRVNLLSFLQSVSSRMSRRGWHHIMKFAS